MKIWWRVRRWWIWTRFGRSLRLVTWLVQEDEYQRTRAFVGGREFGHSPACKLMVLRDMIRD